MNKEIEKLSNEQLVFRILQDTYNEGYYQIASRSIISEPQERTFKLKRELLRRLQNNRSGNALKEVAKEAKNEQLEVIKEYKAVEDYKKRLVGEIEKEIPNDWTYHDGRTIKNVVKDLINIK